MFQWRHFLRGTRGATFQYKVLIVVILIMEQNSIDIIVTNENSINAVQNEPSVWDTELN